MTLEAWTEKGLSEVSELRSFSGSSPAVVSAPAGFDNDLVWGSAVLSIESWVGSSAFSALWLEEVRLPVVPRQPSGFYTWPCVGVHHPQNFTASLNTLVANSAKP